MSRAICTSPSLTTYGCLLTDVVNEHGTTVALALGLGVIVTGLVTA